MGLIRNLLFQRADGNPFHRPKCITSPPGLEQGKVGGEILKLPYGYKSLYYYVNAIH